MFLNFYGLKEQPFHVTPDPRFLYLSAAHREALASLFYGISAGRGFLALIAKPGMGKTTLLFQLLKAFRSSARTAFIFQTQCTSREFLRFLLLELGCEIHGERDLVSIHDEFNRCLLQEARAGRRFIVVIDEAQNLEPPVLETVRLLSDFETPKGKLVQIVLSGQPELADKLAHSSLRQLRQRISVFAALPPLPPPEVERYIEHRLRVAGGQGKSIFTPEALKTVAEVSEGIPRNVNNLCFNILSVGCALQQKTIDAEIVREVASDFDLTALRSEAATTGLESHTTAALNLSTKQEPIESTMSAFPPAADQAELFAAVAYMRKIVQLLNDRHRPIN
jgi:general secretion pathway protein A